MRLKKISLRNFRCFEHLDIDLHPRLTVFVGDNGAGKTAVLDGIATALSPVLTQLSSADQRLTGRGIKDADFRREFWADVQGRQRQGSADYAQVEAETTDGLRWDYWRPSRAGKEPARKTGTSDLKQALEPLVDSYRSEMPQLTPVFAYYGARRGYIEVPERLRASKQNYDHPTAALIGSLDSLGDFRAMLAWFDSEEAAELRANKGVVDDDFDPSRALEAVRASVDRLLGASYRDPRFNKDHKFVLTRAVDNVDLLVGQLSQGYQSMLAMAMDFAQRLATANPHLDYGSTPANHTLFDEIEKLRRLDPTYDTQVETPFLDTPTLSAPAIMLVDEIDLHLHPSWQQRILGDLLRAFPLTQFVVTTHSPQVLSTVARDNIRVLRQTEDGLEAARPDFSPLAHAAGDALTRIMNVHREPPMPLQERIHLYEQKVRNGQENSADAVELRAELNRAGYQVHDSDLATWRFLAQRKKA